MSDKTILTLTRLDRLVKRAKVIFLGEDLCAESELVALEVRTSCPFYARVDRVFASIRGFSPAAVQGDRLYWRKRQPRRRERPAELPHAHLRR
jgi:hypothetical protein